MKHLRKFESVSDMQTAVANTEIDFIGLAYDNGEPKINIATVEPPTYDYVEIGNIRWATKNIGAESETDTGLYFQWGDTKGYTADQVGTGDGQKAFKWTDYKFNPSGDGRTFTKYDGSYSQLDPEDDAAHVNMGGYWMMPTISNWYSLTDNTTNEWVTNYNDSGVNGRLFTDKTDSSKKLFFPASGYCSNGLVNYGGNRGYVWGCLVNRDNTNNANYLYFYNKYGAESKNDFNRCFGLVVRGVQVM